MRKVMLATFFLLFCVIPCSAETLKGKLESVNMQKQEIVVDGVTVKIAKNTTLIGENTRVNTMVSITLHTLISYTGRTATCHGAKTGPAEFMATKVRVYEDR